MVNEVVTGVDQIISYLSIKGETNINKLSEDIGINVETIMELAKALEKLNKIKITHKLGRVYVKIK
ncbi:MAG: hypothetical protein QXD23_01280 [Candidatus Micrarchaeaceae archaeon]